MHRQATPGRALKRLREKQDRREHEQGSSTLPAAHFLRTAEDQSARLFLRPRTEGIFTLVSHVPDLLESRAGSSLKRRVPPYCLCNYVSIRQLSRVTTGT
ncbi:hypothetical protein O1611_g3509 [Lasiodiplodia mahajangana]|uniref:Uncharacterized protein n=1 Tax=Lasiodiplodia mahajangana TaxID=1108764 RepID=A0ACC2JRL1_9PEZI|nr:hypothetical protein O1611_g3509 [Lasiodiplodia mahajangana]